jgi:inner membrane protein YidH
MSDLNDPRVLFAAERTLLAWSRTSLTLMAFGFVVERFGLFAEMLASPHAPPGRPDVILGRGRLHRARHSADAALGAPVPQRPAHAKPAEIPAGYWVSLGTFTSLALAVLGIALTAYLFQGFRP